VTPLKVLFVGGSGTISSACTALAVRSGIRLYVLHRGRTNTWPLPVGATPLRGDIRDQQSTRDALGDLEFDAVVNWNAYTTDHVESDIALFAGRTRQYVFISSASAYQTPPARLPVTESTPLRNPFLPYSQNKIACEQVLVSAYRDSGFPATIVRPSHTYDRRSVPLDGGWTAIQRMRQGREIVIHGDGTSLWTLTHHRDFAAGFVPLLGHPATIGDSFHITSDEALTWNQIARTLAAAAGVEARIVHVPSAAIAAADPEWGSALLGDQAHSMVFDNSKIKRLVPGFRATIPFHEGAREIIAWHDADSTRHRVDARVDALMDSLVDRFRIGDAPSSPH
jgi:nucleoside-diphosphate-sugar epimerase